MKTDAKPVYSTCTFQPTIRAIADPLNGTRENDNRDKRRRIREWDTL